MSVWDKLKFRSTPASNEANYIDAKQADQWSEIRGLSQSGVSVTPETSLRFSAVWCAVRLLSEIPASLPKSIITQNNDGSFKQLFDDPIASLLEFPNEFMTGFDFHELMNSSLQLKGNAVAVIFRNSKGDPNRIIPVDWNTVFPYIHQGKLIYEVNDMLFNIHGTFFSDDILHYKIFSRNGIVGRSPIQVAKDNIGLAISAENFGSEFFAKGGNHKAVIETQSGFKSYEDYKKWREKFDEEHSGVRSNQGTPVLQPGMSYKQLGMSMEDAQFIATRQFQISDIARWFNVPAHMLHDLSKATFSNIEHQDLQFIKYSLRGLITRQEKEWEFKMFSPERRNRIDVKFNMDDMARGDMTARSNYITSMVNGGILVQNEGRKIEGLPPLEGGDVIRLPQNIVGKPATTQNP